MSKKLRAPLTNGIINLIDNRQMPWPMNIVTIALSRTDHRLEPIWHGVENILREHIRQAMRR